MSYILEGLKKLEQKRQQEEKRPAQQFTFQGAGMEKPVKKPVWPYILVAALFLNAGAIVWWLAPWRSTGRNTSAPQSTVQKPVPAVASSSAAEPRKEMRPVAAKAEQPLKTENLPKARNAEKERPLPLAKETPAPQQPSAAQSQPTPPPKSKPPADGHIVKLNELPPEIRSGLPDLRVSAHFYSTDKQARFARINDKILHEGESLISGLKVEEINSGGTVFSFQGYRFLIGINENR